ncbi:MAG: universal stress protein [Solirubrobacteraceae bacterium]|jgi:nucleotide-binding universal stress UspA family protein
MPQVIVSYDGTRNDRDALALGRLFAHAGAAITLAYVRHAAESDPQREAAAQADAEHLLAAGAGLLGTDAVGQRVILASSTAEGLATLANELGADVIAFGSSYRTPPGHVDVPHTAEQLLDRAISCSLALAPAGLRREPVEHSIGTISVYDEDDDPAAQATAASLAHALGAVVTGSEADLLVIASRTAAAAGQLLLSATGRERIERASSPVLLLARGASLTF